MRRARWIALGLLVSCGARGPAAVDVDRLLATRGAIDARLDLEIRIIADPRDVAGRLALAALDEQIGRPTEAIGALEEVEALGGPLGVRWRGEDRARLARLIAARGRARLARGAATALADLERARQLGAEVTGDELGAARAARALVALRHSDAEVRSEGRGTLAALSARGDPAWLGARPGASPAQRGQFGAWLWQRGARRAAWDELSAWHAAEPPPRDPALQAAYLVAARWWIPLDLRPPPAGELVGAERCAFTACSAREIAGDDRAERALLVAPLGPPLRDPDEAAALAAITLRQALRGEAAWGPALAARVDLAAFGDPAQLATLPRYVQPIFARLTGRDAPAVGEAAPAAGEAAAADQRLVVAAERVLAGAAVELAELGSAPYGDALRAVATPRAPFTGDPLAEAVARHALASVPTTLRADQLRAIAIAYARDPVVADRLGRDAVAGAPDAAVVHATLGAVFDALGDPARARAAWQAAVTASAEPAFLRGLAEAEARQGDGDAALINATTAAAGSGDPALVWTGVAAALAGCGRYAQALEASRSAIELSGPDTLATALDVAATASRALGRDAQADALTRRRAQLGTGDGVVSDGDPTAASRALAGHRHAATAASVARLWSAARWNPRDVALRDALLRALPADDARRGPLVTELVELAGDRDPAVRRAAVAALKQVA